MNEIVFKYRTKTWKMHKDPYCFVLSKLSGDNWGVVGYYSSPKYIVQRLVKENFITTKDGKEFLSSLNAVMDDLGTAINNALNRA